jgi:methyl-accepting chemotaxis protein
MFQNQEIGRCLDMNKLFNIIKRLIVAFENIRISSKLIYFFLGLSLVPICIVGITSYLSFHEAVKQKIRIYALDNSAQIASNILAKQKEFQSISDLLLNNQSFLAAIHRLEAANPNDQAVKNEVGSCFGDYMIANRDVFGMIYISNNGRNYSAVKAKDYESDLLGYIENFQKTAYYKEVINSGGSVRWSHAIPLKASNFLMLARSIKSETVGEPIGIVAILIDEETIDKIINQAIYGQTEVSLDDAPYFSVIIDNDGKFVSSPYKDDIGKGIKQIIHNCKPLELLFNNRASASDYSSSENQGSYDSIVKGRPAFVTYKSIGLNKNIGGASGWHLVSFTYHSFLFGEVNAIGLMTLLIAFVAAVIAILISLSVSASISYPLNQVVATMSRAEKGDLTSRVSIHSRNELGVLSQSYNQMVEEISGLLVDAKCAIDAMLSRSTDLERSSDQSALSAKVVATAMGEITQGTLNQTRETEKSANQMSELAEQIETVVNHTSDVEQITSATKNQSVKAKNAVNGLKEKTSLTEDMTKEVIHTIGDLRKSTEEIRKVTDVITNLTEQTNLLGLNASIEAARAGEMGHGFAVVAEEINKLAQQSRDATKIINNILYTIEQKAILSAETIEKTHQALAEQIEAVDSAQTSFDEIIAAMDSAVKKIDNMNERIKKMNVLKEQTMQAISSISAISEETAASAEEVAASSLEQTAGAEQVKILAGGLRHMAEQLVKDIAKFKINN